MRTFFIALAAVMSLSLAGCADGGPGPKQTVGAVGGAVLGGLAGSQVGGGSGRLIATGAGAVLGGLAGSEIGKSLDRADKMYMERTAADALENNRTGQSSSWKNPDSGHSGTVTPVETYERESGAPCREYQTTIIVDGRQERGYGTACRQPDGSWKIES